MPTIDRKDGGISSYIQLIAEPLGRLVELHLITHKGENDLPIENTQIHYITNGLKNFFLVKKEFLQILNEVKPNIFHSNCCWYPFSAYSILWAKNAGYDVVLSPHGMLEPWILHRNYWKKKVPALLLYQLRAIKKADLLHTTANNERDNILKLGWNKNICIIGNCVNTDTINIKNSWKKTKTILFLSRVHPKKGLNILIDATSQIKKDLIGYRIIVAGESYGNYVDELKAQAKEKRVDDIFDFIGGVYGDDKWKLYKESDVFVLPTYSENFGIVIAEALASGTPVITTHGTPWEELNSRECGWWIPIGVQPLIGALMNFLSCDEEKLMYMGLNGRKLIENKYSCEIIAQQFVDMYKQL